MSIRYSYENFTTKGHGVIEYTNSSYDGDGKKTKRRRKPKAKYATRWPSAAPLKKKTIVTKQKTNKTLHKQAQAIFRQRNPGQQPKKGQIKAIIRELQKRGSKVVVPKSKKVKSTSHSNNKKTEAETKIDELTLKVFSKRFPGQKPEPGQLKELKQEVISERRKLGL